MFRFSVNNLQKLRACIRQYNTGLSANRSLGATTETLSFIPEYKSGLEACGDENWDVAQQNIKRAIDVCTNAMGPLSPQVVHLNRLMLDICYTSQQSTGTATPYAETLMESTLASDENDSETTIDALRLGRFFLQSGRTENVRKLESHLRNSVEGNVCLASAYITGREFSEGMYILEGLQSSPVVLSNLGGGVLLEGGQTAPITALEFLNAAIDLLEDSTDDLLNAHVRCNAGVVCLVAREPEKAIEHLSSAMDSISRIEEPKSENNINLPKYNSIAITKGRILAQMGAYYHVTEQAVSAEGMHRAAMEVFEEQASHSPRRDMVYSRALDLHGSLLKDWDTRESDSEKLFQKALDLRENVSNWTVPDEILWLDDTWGNMPKY